MSPCTPATPGTGPTRGSAGVEGRRGSSELRGVRYEAELLLDGRGLYEAELLDWRGLYGAEMPDSRGVISGLRSARSQKTKSRLSEAWWYGLGWVLGRW